MKHFLALCLMTCLSLPASVNMPVLATGLVGVAVLATPATVRADVVPAEDDVDQLHEEATAPLLSFDFGQAFWNFVIFVCVLAVLSIFVWPSVLGGLQSREDKIREDLEFAEKANAEAQAILAGYQSKLDEAALQTQAMLAQARQDAEANGQRIIEQAKAEAEAQRERAVADIDNAKKVAMSEIASRTSEMAMQVARGIVGRELSADDHADLIQQAMKRLPSQN